MRDPVIAFCTTCRGRAQHLKITLPRNLADNADYPNARFIVVDYNSQDDLIEYLRTQHGSDIHSGRLTVYSTRDPGTFRMAHAKNMAHRLGIIESADILCNLDADNFTGRGFASYIARQFHERDVFLWAKMLQGEMPRGMSGRIVCAKDDFLKVGGYDERFETWSRDDKNFNERLRRLGCIPVEIHRDYLDGVSHNDRMRFKEYPHARNGQAAYQDPPSVDGQPPDYTIANWGKFGCGVVFRNFTWDDPLALTPLPARVFGIGMHKTATTSLHHAFRMLGLDSAHWKSAHWAKAIWTEMTETGRSPTLERNYALCDLPITILYKELDHAYPGSKFILTTRDEAGWLATVRDHWDPTRNTFRAGWDKDPFTHRLHRLVYGKKAFDPEVMITRYRRHNAEVLDYFRDRPNDLLVMPMDAGAGWPELCNFLGNLPIPKVAYPRAYSAY